MSPLPPFLEGIRGLNNYTPRRIRGGRRQDADLVAFVAQELLQIIPTLYNRLYPGLDAREHIPISTNVSPGAMAWAYDSYDQRGKAEFLGANATNIPRADVSKERFPFPIRSIALAYGWTVEEMLASEYAGTRLDARKADACRRGIAELEQSILMLGDTSHGLPGFLTNPSTPIVVLPSGKNWAAATPQEILMDLNALVDAVWVGTFQVHVVDTILLDPQRFRIAQVTQLDATSSDSVLTYFLKTNTQIREVRPLRELATAGLGGVPAALAYQKDPGVLNGVIPLPFQQLPPEMRGLEVLINCWERIGGTVWFYPLAAAMGIGLGS